MRLKHNKKRNTAFVYEALIRELTKSVIKNNKNKQNKIVSIMKEHFSSESALSQELELYKTLYETREIEKRLAERIVVEAKQQYCNLDKRKIFKEQSALINKINRTLSKELFTNFVPNYKNLASVYSIFQETLPAKDRVLLEENIVLQMSESSPAVKEEKMPIDNIVYNSFVTKFNEEYSSVLSEEQKSLLGKYISSFADNGLEMKVYLNEEVGNLKNKLIKIKNKCISEADNHLKDKLDKVYCLLDSYKDKEVDLDLVEIVLNTQQIVNELEENDINS